MEPKATSTALGVSTDIKSPLFIKIDSLHANGPPQIASLAERHINPNIYKTCSKVAVYSDLFVEVTVYDHHQAKNMLSLPVVTKYVPFNGASRQWNTTLKLPVNYNQLPLGSYLDIAIYEISDTRAKLFARGTLSVYNHDNYALRKGRQKVAVYLADNAPTGVCYKEKLPGITQKEEDVINYEQSKLPRVPWLDKLVIPRVSTPDTTSSGDYSLTVELPTYDLPIVYNDVEVPDQAPVETIEAVAATPLLPKSTIISSVTIDERQNHRVIDAIVESDEDDPIEAKYHRLERNINNALLDKEIKPSPQVRDELLRILMKPANADLSDNEKNLIWKFRYYFSRNNDSGTASASFLPKFLKSLAWENEYEIDHTFSEIIPRYWTVEKIHIGDALELLGTFFNPLTLYPNIRPSNSGDRVSKNEEEKLNKITQQVKYIRKMAVDRLTLANNDELLLYLLQLVQALKYEALIYTGRDEAILDSPLAQFLIERSVEVPKLGNFLYWYLKVENEDMISQSKMGKNDPATIYSVILNQYIADLKSYCNSQHKKLPYYSHLKRQIWFVKKLNGLVGLLRTTFKKNESTARKVEFLREYLSNGSNEFLKFPEPFPLPLDPSVMVCGCYPQESSVFKSSLSPLKITLKTVEIVGNTKKYGKYPMMFKIGDDLRQDQLVIQIINLMDQLLKNENLDLKLTPYKILATSPIAGMIQFIPNETLDSILSQSFPGDNYPFTVGGNEIQPNGILGYLRLHSREQPRYEPAAKSIWYSPNESTHSPPPALITGTEIQDDSSLPRLPNDLGASTMVMDNYIKSCAGYCVITYLLGVGDRHLDNLLLSPNGKFWHADFGYILGRDPKPFPPLMKLPIQIIDGMGGLSHENFSLFKGYCFTTYITLRKNSSLILNLFELMLEANIPDIKINSAQAIEKVEEKFRMDMSEEEAIVHFQNLIGDSVQAFIPVVIDKLHSLAQYWRA